MMPRSTDVSTGTIKATDWMKMLWRYKNTPTFNPLEVRIYFGFITIKNFISIIFHYQITDYFTITIKQSYFFQMSINFNDSVFNDL